jgi:MFS family permease
MSENVSGTDLLARMDEAELNGLHWKIMFISGMGFFTDAYDLFIIGVVMEMLKKEWTISPVAQGLVTSTALLASAVGAVLFGRIADMLGRKRIYGYEVLVLVAGAVASALSPDIWWLIFFRIILGLGIGGDYPVSSTIMAEYSSKRTRGMMVTLVFTMQAAGLIVGPLLAAALIGSGMPENIAWRVLLALGAVPAMAVFQMRRHLAETPRYLLATGHHDEFTETANSLLGEMRGSKASGYPSETGRSRSQHRAAARASFWEGFTKLTSERRLLVRLIGASLAWFLMDFAYYGNTVSSPLVLDAITPDRTLLWHVLLQLAVFTVAAAPGYLVAAAMMDRMGRKSIQILGFAMMAVTFAVMALIPGVDKFVVPFLIIYGVSYFFTEFGPNATTFVYPAEIFPVEGRTTGHGIAAAAGKLGGYIGVFLFPILLHWNGLLAAELAAAVVSVFGLLVTLWMLPETMGQSLEELNAPEREGAGQLALAGH